MWEGKIEKEENPHVLNTPSFSVQWFENRLHQVKAQVEEMYQQFRLSEALKNIYSLIWDDFCSWYLEWMKPALEGTISKAEYEKTILFFETRTTKKKKQEMN